VDEVGELGGIANEENRSVVTNHIPVTLFGVELDGETTRITFSICRTLLTSNSGKARENGSSLANLVQKFGLAKFGHIVSDLEVTVG
jgi:hypothetical protein